MQGKRIMIELLMEGHDPEEAFNQALDGIRAVV